MFQNQPYILPHLHPYKILEVADGGKDSNTLKKGGRKGK